MPSPPERELFARGYASALADSINRSSLNRDVTINTLFNSRAGQARTRLALGDQRADRLEALVRAERLVDRSRRAMGNSTTAQQLHDMGGGIRHIPLTKHALLARMLAAVLDPVRMNQGVAERVARMLVSNDPGALRQGAAIIARNGAWMNALRRATSSAARTGNVIRAIGTPSPDRRADTDALNNYATADALSP